MNIPCAVSGRMYAVRPELIAPILVENIRFIGLAAVQAASEQDGHSIPDARSPSTASAASESAFGCKCSTK